MSSRFPRANKNFGQHFLTSSKVIHQITSSVPEKCEAIIEVGPGPAVLSPKLFQHHLPFFVIELDKRFKDLLSPYVISEHFFQEDALHFDWNSFVTKFPFKSFWLVSNLPYNISVPLTLQFMRVPQITHMTLMYQKEVAQKILPSESRNSMNSLHVLIKTQFDVKHLIDAPPGAFSPAPKVDSQVLSFSRKNKGDLTLERIDDFETFLRLIFSQKRKQLASLLRKVWGQEKTQERLNFLHLDPQIRAEALSYDQVLQLYLKSE